MDEILGRLTPVIRARVNRVFRCARRNAADREDAAQDIWLKLLSDDRRQLSAFDPARGSLENYVGMIAERELFNRVRSARVKQRCRDQLAEMPGSPASSPEHVALHRDLLSSLSAYLIGRLNARDRAIFNYLYFSDLDLEEIAARLGVSLQVVYNRRSHIRRLARAYRDGLQRSPVSPRSSASNDNQRR